MSPYLTPSWIGWALFMAGILAANVGHRSLVAQGNRGCAPRDKFDVYDFRISPQRIKRLWTAHRSLMPTHHVPRAMLLTGGILIAAGFSTMVVNSILVAK